MNGQGPPTKHFVCNQIANGYLCHLQRPGQMPILLFAQTPDQAAGYLIGLLTEESAATEQQPQRPSVAAPQAPTATLASSAEMKPPPTKARCAISKPPASPARACWTCSSGSNRDS